MLDNPKTEFENTLPILTTKDENLIKTTPLQTKPLLIMKFLDFEKDQKHN